jgi:RNA polymerase sigma-70 factor (ECF subfamily)
VPTTSGDIGRAIAGARDGDADSIAVLWRAHQPLLLRYLRGRGAQDAADIASQTWIDAARNLHRFEGDADDFRRWIFTIARRRLVDERRRVGRREARWLGAVRPDDTVPGADDAFDERDSVSRALALVARLPDKTRDAVLLRYVADLSVADAAAVMGLRPGHVRVLAHRGLQQLEQILAAKTGEVVTLPVLPTMNPLT